MAQIYAQTITLGRLFNGEIKYMPEKLVTVATFDVSLEAHVFKMHLEEAEIECFIQN